MRLKLISAGALGSVARFPPLPEAKFDWLPLSGSRSRVTPASGADSVL